jgi:FixJ family two-component response regulator
VDAERHQFIAKPFDAQKLLEKIKRTLSEKI